MIYNTVRLHQALEYLTLREFFELHQPKKKGGVVANQMNEYRELIISGRQYIILFPYRDF
jgi:hypothetical protein